MRPDAYLLSYSSYIDIIKKKLGAYYSLYINIVTQKLKSVIYFEFSKKRINNEKMKRRDYSYQMLKKISYFEYKFDIIIV